MSYDDFIKLMPGIAAICAIIGSILAAYFTFRFNANRNDKIEKIQRLENCYLAFHQYYNLVNAGTFPWSRVGRGGITYDQANDMFIEANKNSPDGLYPKLRFTVVLLFPELLGLLDEILKSNDKIMTQLASAKESFKETGDYSVFERIEWGSYAQEMDALRIKIDIEFKKAIKNRKLL